MLHGIAAASKGMVKEGLILSVEDGLVLLRLLILGQPSVIVDIVFRKRWLCGRQRRRQVIRQATCTVPILVGRRLAERLVRKRVVGHVRLAFWVPGVSSIVIKQSRPSQFGRLPCGSPSLSPRSLPLRIRLVDVVAPFANRLLAISGGGFNARANSRRLQEPNETFLCFV